MTAPFKFVSLWDMLKYEAELLFSAASYLASTISDWRLHVQLLQAGVTAPYSTSLEHKAMFLKSIERLRDSANELNMAVAAKAGSDAFDFYLEALSSPFPLSAHNLGRMIPPADRLLHAYIAEANSRQFYVVDGKHASFFTDTESLFGVEVDDAFPSASVEIRDAGKCRALGRWTACVLHLMRALEPALNALAAHFGVATDQNWNKALDQIDCKLKELKKATNGASEEQWASEASAHLRVIKNAWRNHAAHGRSRYDEEETVAIYDNVRPLMRNLATRLSEQQP